MSHGAAARGGLGAALGSTVFGALGVIAGLRLFAAYGMLPLLLGLTALIQGFRAYRRGRVVLAVPGLVLGAIAVVMGAWDVYRVMVAIEKLEF